MAFNFPDTSGQATDGSFTHTAGGITYSWDGSTWTATGTYSEISTLDQVLARGNSTTRSIETTGQILFSNNYANLASLPSATTYHGMFAHVHAEAHGYFAHAGAWTQLIDTGSSIGELGNVSATAPTNGQALVWDGSNWAPGTVSVTSTLADLTDTDIDTIGQTATPLSDGDYLFYNSTTSKWQNAPFTISTLDYAYFGNSVQIEGNQAGTALLLSTGSHPVAISDNTFSTGTEGQVLTAVGNDGGGNATGVRWSNTSGLQTRTSNFADTNLLSPDAADYITITTAKTYVLHKIETDNPAWVTVYTDPSSRTADSSRSETTDPIPGTGVIAEVITTGATTQKITPGTIGWNDESTPSTNAYLKVVNKDPSVNKVIRVTLHYVALEA